MNRKATPKKAKKTKEQKKNIKSQNWLLYGAAAVIIIALFLVTATAASKFFQTEKYYVLNQNVPTRTQITSEMLEPITAPEGSSPPNAIGIADVQSGNVYTQYPLNEGDVLTMSNVGGQEDISVGIPDQWVVTNFSVGADDAVGGRIQRGTYFDLMVVSDQGSYYPFVNILALDTTVDLSNASSSEAADTEEAHEGQTTQYVVGMSPSDAAKLQDIMSKNSGQIKLVLSPRQNEYKAPQISDYEGLFSYDTNDSPKNMGEGTDYTFTDVERDEFGVPLDDQEESCSEGNAKIKGDACKAKTSDTTDTDTSSDSTTDE